MTRGGAKWREGGSTRVKSGVAREGKRITTERARGKGEAGSFGWMIAVDRAREDREAERERKREWEGEKGERSGRENEFSLAVR